MSLAAVMIREEEALAFFCSLLNIETVPGLVLLYYTRAAFGML